jgi:hypothetical protein
MPTTATTTMAITVTTTRIRRTRRSLQVVEVEPIWPLWTRSTSMVSGGRQHSLFHIPIFYEHQLRQLVSRFLLLARRLGSIGSTVSHGVMRDGGYTPKRFPGSGYARAYQVFIFSGVHLRIWRSGLCCKCWKDLVSKSLKSSYLAATDIEPSFGRRQIPHHIISYHFKIPRAAEHFHVKKGPK